jgi:hypothetical protein
MGRTALHKLAVLVALELMLDTVIYSVHMEMMEMIILS